MANTAIHPRTSGSNINNLNDVNTDGDLLATRHLEINGGLKIGSGGKTYGSYSAVLKQLFIRSTYDMSEDYGWWIGTQNSTLSTTSNKLYFTVQYGGGFPRFAGDTTLSVPAYIDDGYTPGNDLMNFTGQHRCFIQNELTDMIGLIVSSTGNYVNIDNSLLPTVNESLPICMLSHLPNDKSVFGVVSEKEDTNTTRTYKPSNFVSVKQKTNTNEQRYHINSLGEGGVWITNKNGPTIENGDYITTSTIPGYGQKQTTDQLCNYTVAKITCNCNFTTTPTPKQKVKVTGSGTNQQLDLDESGNIQFENELDSDNNIQNVLPFETRFLLDNGTQITETEYNTRFSNRENVYIACFVGCTYHCG